MIRAVVADAIVPASVLVSACLSSVSSASSVVNF